VVAVVVAAAGAAGAVVVVVGAVVAAVAAVAVVCSGGASAQPVLSAHTDRVRHGSSATHTRDERDNLGVDTIRLLWMLCYDGHGPSA
jgi:hypothetical protein